MRGTVFSLSLMMFLGALYQAGAMSGFAVSAASAGCAANGSRSATIVKFTIQNDNVTRCDTIYEAFKADYPHLNIQGTKCAFIRRNIGQSGLANGPDDTINYLSVMDINGGNVRDLDRYPLWVQNNNPQSPMFTHTIDWPAGDYIYYTKQVKWWYEGDGVPTTEVWKVKYNDPSSKTRVVNYWSAQTFSMSLDGTRAGVTDLSNNEFHCLPHAFPPAANPTKQGWDSKVWVGCGTYISPSGKYHWHFFEGGHDNWRINTWNPPTELLATVDVGSADFPVWSVDKSLTSETIGRGPMEWSRWAVNSDKWICGCTYLYNTHVSPPVGVGHNQVLCNWIDHKVIVTSRNWQDSVTKCTIRHSDPGDMWVAGGPCGSYEDVSGAWIPTSVTTGCTLVEARQPIRSSLREFSSSVKFNVFTLQGKCLGAWDARRVSGKAWSSLPGGACIVKPVSAGRACVRVTVSGL
jgi:hypothetical protein